MEESLLGFLTAARPELDVVDDEDIYHLVEVDEVVDVVVASSLGVLLHELFTGNVEDGLFGVQLLGLETNGVGEVGFAEAYVAVEQQRIESGLPRFLCHGVAGGASQAVALALDEVLQRVGGAQLRGDAVLLEAGDDERIGQFARVLFININGHIGEGVLHRAAAVGGEGGFDGVGGDGLVHYDAVFQHAVGA